MKKNILFITIIILSSSFLHAQENLKIDPAKSELKWSGDYTFYFGGHYGTIQFKEGQFIKTKNKITGGSFIVDMNTMINTDGDYSEGLINHLKDPDFFDVKKFPTATLVVSDVYYSNPTHLHIGADLTIKGITLRIKFRAEVNFEKSQMVAKFKIDRTRWGITYNNELKDDAISDAIAFEAVLTLQ